MSEQEKSMLKQQHDAVSALNKALDDLLKLRVPLIVMSKDKPDTPDYHSLIIEIESHEETHKVEGSTFVVANLYIEPISVVIAKAKEMMADKGLKTGSGGGGRDPYDIK